MQSIYRRPTDGRKAMNRNPIMRAQMRNAMMARLKREVEIEETKRKEQEVNALLDAQGHGKTATRRRKKPAEGV